MKKIDKIYDDYTLFQNDEIERRAFLLGVKSCNEKTYYALQGKIFIEMQTTLYKNVSEMVYDACIKYFGKFEACKAEQYIDELEFIPNIDDDTIRASKNWLNILNFKTM